MRFIFIYLHTKTKYRCDKIVNNNDQLIHVTLLITLVFSVSWYGPIGLLVFPCISPYFFPNH